MKLLKVLILVCVCSQGAIAQQNELKFHEIKAEYYFGTIIEHNPDISHLITGRPSGVMLSYNRKPYGFNEWEGRYNYPDWGFTYIYQDLDNEFLGEIHGLYGHFNFYFWERRLSIGVGQGIGYSNKPYDPELNFENNAYGSSLLSSTLLKFNFVQENIVKGVGVSLGMGVIHYSNANFKAPNNSTNTFYLSAGVSYLFNSINYPEGLVPVAWDSKNYAERIHYNLVVRSGVNEADVNGLGQFPFITVSAFADKRINYKSSFQLGADVFFSRMIESLLKYRAVAFPEDNLSGFEDSRRIGVFIGHELRFNKTAFVSQVGYYVYWPYEFENRIYNRLGLKRYITENLFGSVTVKAHYAKAEAVEFSIGIRL